MLRADRGNRQGEGCEEDSAFVTDGALFSIKPIGRNGEHVVALDADAVKDGTDDGAWLGGLGRGGRGWSGDFLRRALGGHERIL